jgi:hypothetical protein
MVKKNRDMGGVARELALLPASIVDPIDRRRSRD